MSSCVLSIAGPVDFFLAGERDAGGLESRDHLSADLCISEGHHDLTHLQRVSGQTDQRHLKKSILQVDVGSGDIRDSPDRAGICDHPKGKIILDIDDSLLSLFAAAGSACCPYVL